MASATLSQSFPCVRSSRLNRKGMSKYAMVAIVAGCTLLARFGFGLPNLAFATVASPTVMKASQAVLSREAHAQTAQERKRKQNATTYNATLQLGDGFPDITFPIVTEGPRWTTCFVAAHEPTRDVLEEWVVPAVRERVSAFKAWRQQQEPQVATVRCAPRATDATFSVECLQCVSGSASPWPLQGRVDDVNSEAIMTFTRLHACMGFCKSGVVTVNV